jgi:hypothetical protein
MPKEEEGARSGEERSDPGTGAGLFIPHSFATTVPDRAAQTCTGSHELRLDGEDGAWYTESSVARRR